MSKLIYKEYGYLAEAKWPSLTLDKTEIRGLNTYHDGHRELSNSGIFCIIKPHKILSVALTPGEKESLSIWITTEDK